MSDSNSTKRCTRCDDPSPEFYKGNPSACKKCQLKAVREGRRKNAAHSIASQKAHRQIPEVKEYYRRLGRERMKRIKGTPKHTARKMLRSAVARGVVSRLPCFYCGDPKTEAHHDDYSKPLDVRWVCFKCHREKEHGLDSK